jgi:hypothetical protein
MVTYLHKIVRTSVAKFLIFMKNPQFQLMFFLKKIGFGSKKMEPHVLV